MKALQKDFIRSKLVKDCSKMLRKVGQFNKIHIIWVPGHTGILENEIVDAAAKRGANTKLIGPEPFCGLATSTIRSGIFRLIQ